MLLSYITFGPALSTVAMDFLVENGFPSFKKICSHCEPGFLATSHIFSCILQMSNMITYIYIYTNTLRISCVHFRLIPSLQLSGRQATACVPGSRLHVESLRLEQGDLQNVPKVPNHPTNCRPTIGQVE